MKKIALTLFAAVAAIFIYSCGGGGVETSAEMKDFIGMCNGTDGSVQKALDKYAADSTVAMSDMGMYNLKDGKAIKKEGDCYETEFTGGIVTYTYNICWTGGKISKIEEKPIK